MLPVTDAELLEQLGEDQSNIGKIYPYAQGAVEDVQGDAISLQLMQATYEVQMDDWITGSDGYLVLPRCPLVSITSIKYDDVNNAEQTLAASNYFLDTASLPGRIRWSSNATLPGLYDKPNCVRIRYVAGHGAAGATTDAQQSAVPAVAKSCVKIRTTDLWDRRMTEGVGVIAKSEAYFNMIGKIRIPV